MIPLVSQTPGPTTPSGGEPLRPGRIELGDAQRRRDVDATARLEVEAPDRAVATLRAP